MRNSEINWMVPESVMGDDERHYQLVIPAGRVLSTHWEKNKDRMLFRDGKARPKLGKVTLYVDLALDLMTYSVGTVPFNEQNIYEWGPDGKIKD